MSAGVFGALFAKQVALLASKRVAADGAFLINNNNSIIAATLTNRAATRPV
jgi:hypothetical protein